jgi:hypothetical protein
MVDIAKHETDLGRVGFDGWFAEISVEGIEKRGFAQFDGGLEPTKLLSPVG